jgi:hypothetical protein
MAGTDLRLGSDQAPRGFSGTVAAGVRRLTLRLNGTAGSMDLGSEAALERTVFG